jgi:TatD DNase family protein
VIDFHCHLDLYPDPLAVRDECKRRSIEILSVTTTPSAWRGTLGLASGSPGIKTALGLHPQLAHERKSELSLFDALINETRFVGEVGLDGSPELQPYWKDQVQVFEHILTRATIDSGKVFSIHSKNAATEVLDRIDRFKAAGRFVLHWFSGSVAELDRAIEYDCWFSVGPAMTLSAKGRKLIAMMPSDRVLTESDGPFAQIRGESIKPWQLHPVMNELTDAWQMTEPAAAQKVRSNLNSLLDF